MSEQKPDMSKVIVGTRVRYRSGDEAEVTDVRKGEKNPFCTDNGIWHNADGSCCVKNFFKYDIIEIISHPTATEDERDDGVVDEVHLQSPEPTPLAAPCDEKASMRDMLAMAALTGFLAHGETVGRCSAMVLCGRRQGVESEVKLSDNRKEMFDLACERVALFVLVVFALGLAYHGAFCLLRH